MAIEVFVIDVTKGESPFRWWEINRVVEPPEAGWLPSNDWNGWEARYENDTEKHKRTTRKFNSLPEQIGRIFDFLNGEYTRKAWSGVMKENLIADPTMHGAGVHVIDSGGWLSTHLDYSRHPLVSGKERRLNLIVFLNPEWKKEWGGALQLCNPMGDPIKEIYPEPGKLVAFETGDESYHGVSKVVGPVPRITAAVYFLSDLRPGVTRQRALFIPNRGSM